MRPRPPRLTSAMNGGRWGEETGEMIQETFEILMDQDPKAKRIYNPKAEAQDQPEPVVEQPEPVVEEQRSEEVVAGEGGVCPT
ncbi:hypothetical protein PIB30_086873 [Stylosanthes scabra]|uniref:Uncharacterized protein n=1 Tax=Stylosanthes scabra TaxID=79078 RepID=A0ABU6WRK7_9FABA|nr:hypothetical protein [Stylosanthes scabra]